MIKLKLNLMIMIRYYLVMLDNLSNYPSPEYTSEKENIKKLFKQNNTSTEASNYGYISDNNLNKFIEEAFKPHVIIETNKTTIKYSYTGWYMFGINDVKRDVKKAIVAHKQKIKQKIRGLFKSLVYLNAVYKTTLHKIYDPNYLFPLMSNMSVMDVHKCGGLDEILLEKV